MVNVRHILSMKGDDIWVVRPDESVFNALNLMADKDVGALLVTDKGKLVGIFSERDYARKIVLLGKSSLDTPVRDVMTKNVVYIDSGQSMVDCMEIMTEKRIRHLPVMENENLIGVISIGDVVKAIISDQEFIIRQLENYITGYPNSQ